MLFGLLMLPVLAWLYWRGLRPPAEAVVLHPDTALLKSAQRGRSVWGFIPPILYFLALAVGLFALARPTFPVFQADPKAAIVLAVDISRSMQATDVAPSRFEAARAALRTFLHELPEGARVALVTFSRNATTVVPLTTDRHKLLDAVDLLELDFGTAIGDAILESMTALPSLQERKEAKNPRDLANIILLTDGRSVAGIDPLAAAAKANEEQIRINTIGIGRITDGPVPGLPQQYALAAQFDEPTLRSIAQQTEGQYFYVTSLGSLRAAYRNLTKDMNWKVRRDEATGMFALGAALFLMLSMALSQWRRRVL